MHDEFSPLPSDLSREDIPLVAEDGAEAIPEALVAVGVTGSPLDLEPATTKISLKPPNCKYYTVTLLLLCFIAHIG